VEVPAIAATTTSVASSANSSAAGQLVIYTATVTSAPGAGTPTGTVTFTDGNATISGCGTEPVNPGNGTATCQVTYSSPGTHSITAGYSGDTSFGPSTSAALTQTVNPASTGTAVTSSANPAAAGHSVTFTATVSPQPPGAGTPTGTVTFTDGGATIAGCGGLPVNNGQATCTTSALAPGSHTITASYGGDPDFNASSGQLTQQATAAYQVKLLYDPTKVNKSGSTVPVKLQLLNAVGANVSAAGITVTVTSLSPSPAPGKAPTGTFTFLTLDQGPGYQLNVKTTGYPKGTYTLSFTAGSDPTVHTAQFVIG
jgi:hypothetical protein